MSVFFSPTDGTRSRSRGRSSSRLGRRSPGHSWSAAFRKTRVQLAALVEQLESRQLLSALVTTDKPAYAPTDTAHIAGSGFAAGEAVDFQVVNQTTGVTYTTWSTIDDASGNVTTTWSVPMDAPGDRFQLTATDSSGDTAQATFNGLTTWVYTLPTDYSPGQTANIFAGGFNQKQIHRLRR